MFLLINRNFKERPVLEVPAHGLIPLLSNAFSHMMHRHNLSTDDLEQKDSGIRAP
ncbi:unnamed protein product [Ixodes persulcatus]